MHLPHRPAAHGVRHQKQHSVAQNAVPIKRRIQMHRWMAFAQKPPGPCERRDGLSPESPGAGLAMSFASGAEVPQAKILPQRRMNQLLDVGSDATHRLQRRGGKQDPASPP